MGDYGLFSGSAASTLGESAFESGAAAAAESGATEAAATGATEVGAGYAADAGMGGLTGAGEAAAAEPGFWSNLGQGIQSAYQTAQPYINTAQQVMSAANMLKQAIGGGGAPGQPQIMGAASPAPLATAPDESKTGLSPDDYKAREKARWQQIFASSGQGLPGGELPQDILDSINRQAALIT